MPNTTFETIRYAWEQAERCRELAKRAETEEDRAHLREMESTWTRLAGYHHFLEQLGQLNNTIESCASVRRFNGAPG